MPIYEYACGKCGKLFEELVFSAADEAGVACPACGSVEVRGAPLLPSRVPVYCNRSMPWALHVATRL